MQNSREFWEVVKLPGLLGVVFGKMKWNLLSSARLFATPWTSPGQNTGMGSLSLLQGIFQTQGLNQGLLHCRWILYQLSYQGSKDLLIPAPFHGDSEESPRSSPTNQYGWSRRSSGAVMKRNARQSASTGGERPSVIGRLKSWASSWKY